MVTKLNLFDPHNPTCPECNQRVTHIIDTVRYDDPVGDLNLYICPCGTALGVFVPDDLDPNDSYVIEEVTPND